MTFVLMSSFILQCVTDKYIVIFNLDLAKIQLSLLGKNKNKK